MDWELKLEAAAPGRRRRYTLEQKRALLEDACAPGGAVSATARRYGVAPSILFGWKRMMDDTGDKGLDANERVVPFSELKKAEQRIRELERALGRTTLENEILTEAVRLSNEKNGCCAGTRCDEAMERKPGRVRHGGFSAPFVSQKQPGAQAPQHVHQAR